MDGYWTRLHNINSYEASATFKCLLKALCVRLCICSKHSVVNNLSVLSLHLILAKMVRKGSFCALSGVSFTFDLGDQHHIRLTMIGSHNPKNIDVRLITLVTLINRAIMYNIN